MNQGEAVLDALAAWDEGYRQGEDLPLDSLGVSDPALLEELRLRIEKQKRLYVVLKRSAAPADGAGESGGSLPSFPGHETLSKIGQGGMGIVYKARDLQLGRIVAIKTIAEGRHASPDERARFQAEAHAVARLKHANIIAIYSIGEHERQPYLSLEFAEGGSLAIRLAHQPLATREAANLVEILAGAVHAAHQAGIVHRDLKPSNVLLTADGTPKIGDFGLAKLLDSDSGRTLSGQVMGSPSYMAPEQAEGHVKDVGPAADVYALGAILYQSLTGKPPFVGESQLDTLKLVTSTDVISPRRLRPDVPRDLDTICLKCLEKSPAQRYATARELALDLGHLSRGEPVRARRIGGARRFVKWARRHPWQTTTAATLLIAVAGFIGFNYRHNIQLRAEIGRTRAKAAESRRNYQEAGSAIQRILALLDDSRLEGIPRLMELRRDQREEALAFYERVLRQIDANDPSDPVVRADTAKALGDASGLQFRLSLNDRAKEYIQKAIGLIDGQRRERPDDVEYLLIEIDLLIKLGACEMAANQLDSALASGRTAVELAEKLARIDPGKLEHHERLALCHNNYATTLQVLSRETEAKVYYRKAIEIRQSIDPARLRGVTERLAGSLVNEGVILWHESNHQAAEDRFRQAEKLFLSVSPGARQIAGSADLALAQLYINWGGMLHQLGRFDEAIARADAGLSQVEPHLLTEPNDVEARDVCLKLHGNKAYALMGQEKHSDSAKEWLRVVELSPQPVPASYRIRLAIELQQAGEPAKALAQARLVQQGNHVTGVDCYNLAYLFALSATAAQNDRRKPAERRAQISELLIADALRWLELGGEAGVFHDSAMCEHARNDPDLALLRDREAFRKLIGAARAKP